MTRSRKLKAYTALSLAVLFWGTSYVGTKVALEGFPPLVLAFLRFFAAGLLFGVPLLLKGRPRLPRAFHKRMLTISIFLPGLYFVFENYGVKYTTATKASLLAATIPVVVLILSVAFLGEKLSPGRILCMVLSLCGVALLVVSGGGGGDAALSASPGDFLMVGAAFSAACYMILVRKLSGEYNAFLITAFQMIYGSLLFVPFFIVESLVLNWAEVGTRPWIALGVLVLLATIGAFLAYNYALQAIPASRAALFVNVVPFITVAASWMVLGESLTAVQVVGGGLVITAAVLANAARGQESGKREEMSGNRVSANTGPG